MDKCMDRLSDPASAWCNKNSGISLLLYLDTEDGAHG